ncbi:hypothetical protein C8R43DRAFT_959339 [Mycena crocata]|nr:hypothetical protein C8R43DRAFT_959339 [Mycena crocata]
MAGCDEFEKDFTHWKLSLEGRQVDIVMTCHARASSIKRQRLTPTPEATRSDAIAVCRVAFGSVYQVLTRGLAGRTHGGGRRKSERLRAVHHGQIFVPGSFTSRVLASDFFRALTYRSHARRVYVSRHQVATSNRRARQTTSNPPTRRPQSPKGLDPIYTSSRNARQYANEDAVGVTQRQRSREGMCAGAKVFQPRLAFSSIHPTDVGPPRAIQALGRAS